MYSKSFVAASILVATSAGAQTIPASQCNATIPIQCCNLFGRAGKPPMSTPAILPTLGLAGLIYQEPNLPIGVACHSIVAGASCYFPLCCQDTIDSIDGGTVVGLDCVLVNLSL